MVQIPPVPDAATTHFFWIALPVILTTAAGQLISFMANQRRGKEKDNKLATLLENYRLHEHGEWRDTKSSGPLHAENIRYPRTPSE